MVTEVVPDLAQLLDHQHGMCSRAQLTALGLRPQAINHHLSARRWRLVNTVVVATHLGPLTDAARRWAAVLSAPGDVALGSWTALQAHGLRGWGADSPWGSDTPARARRDAIHVVVPRGDQPLRSPGVVVHESRRFRREDVVRVSGLPTHTCVRAAVDAAAWQRWPRTAVGLLAAVIQQGLTTPDELAAQLDVAGAVRHRAAMRFALGDIAGGADSLAEIDAVRLCLVNGLPAPAQQERRRDATGRWRYLDLVWHLAGGRTLVVEIDGRGHMEEARWYDDLLRTAELDVGPGTVLIRLPATAVRLEPARVVAILRRHLDALSPSSAILNPSVVRTTSSYTGTSS